MSEKKAIATIKAYFEHQNLDCAIDTSLGKEGPFSLLVYLGDDPLKNPNALQLTVTEEPPLAGQKKGKASATNYRIQYLVPLAFEVKLTAINDTSNLLHFLNTMIEIPGFILNELENSILFKHIAIMPLTKNSLTIIFATLGIITMTLDLLAEAINEVASGAKRYNELLEEVIEQYSQIEDQNFNSE